MTDQTTSASLLLRIRNHEDGEAWEAFCDVYGPLVYGYCRKRGLDADNSSDVSQEVLIRVAKAIRKFEYDRTRGRFRNWLLKIVNNEISRWQSHSVAALESAATLTGIAADSGHAWSEHFEQHILQAALRIAQNYFEPETWRAFELVWLENYSAPEVAEMVQQPLNYVYTAKSRVLKRLALEIDRLAEEAIF